MLVLFLFPPCLCHQPPLLFIVLLHISKMTLRYFREPLHLWAKWQKLSSEHWTLDQRSELDYGRDITVALFRCRWIKQHQLNEIGLRVLDLENLGYQDDPWVLASRVAQTWYSKLFNLR